MVKSGNRKHDTCHAHSQVAIIILTVDDEWLAPVSCEVKQADK